MKKYLPFVLFLAGCTSSGNSFLTSSDEYKTANIRCDSNSFYALGINHGKSRQDMVLQPADHCDILERKVLTTAYQKGYHEGIKYAPQTVAAPIAPVPYMYSMPPKECKEAYGKKVCGYNCVEAYGQIQCAQNPSHNCVESYGKIRCGLNCREDFGQIKCDE